MQFTLTEDQTLLQESALRLMREEGTLARRRERVASADGFDRRLWATYAELGWLALGLPEAHGGIAGPVEVAVVMEAMGRGLMVEPYLASVVLGGQAVAQGGSAAQQAELLPALAEGRLFLALASAEAGGRYNLAHVETTAQREGAGYRLDGSKAVVLHGASADQLVVAARTGGALRDTSGITLFLVPATAAGISRRAYATLDGQRAAEVTLAGVSVGADAVLGTVDGGLALLESVVDHGLTALSAEAVGIMAALNEATLAHIKTRKQFGRAIGEFQALQHRAVDMYVACELSRAMAYMAACKMGAPAPERAQAAAAAKVQVGRSGRLVGQEAVQLHGGMGMTDELIVGHYFKRLTMIDTLFGDTDHHLARYAQGMTG
ncbi:MAG: pimeloyl-CoA dehydrogenase small subunit [Alphaproteobacteria bacterium]|nr:pimeloyl-CoA dehydrogenase small subunit [Alphaproteobacteria bacterium]